MKKIVIYLILILLLTTTTEAYIEPGLDTGTIAVVLGILVVLIFIFIAIAWYPLKRLFKLLSKKK